MSDFGEPVDFVSDIAKLPDRPTLMHFSPARRSPFGRYLGSPMECQWPHVPFPVFKRLGLSKEAFEALLLAEIDELLAPQLDACP